MPMLSTLRWLLIVTLVVLNTVAHTSVLLLLALAKWLLPLPRWRRALSRLLVRIAERWIAVNSWMMDHLTPLQVDVQGQGSLSRHGWYLVISNHQSWVDILILQKVFNRRIPFLKFFLKQQLIWVPLLGLAWWALDFPFMRRYSRQQIEREPALQGKDVEATRKACARFRQMPVSVMNFVEGTRYTPEKHAAQRSPYPHLLRPKAGGVAFVLNAMGEILQSVVDVSIVYPAGRPTLSDLLAGRIPSVKVRVRERPLPSDLLRGDYENDAAFRDRFQHWINTLWAEKEAEIVALHGEE